MKPILSRWIYQQFLHQIKYSTKPLTPRQQELMARSLPKRSPISGVRHIVVVASGKGGVGKSTTAVNLACTMAQMGNRVGLMDADVFGPSIPLMMNVHEEPLVDDRNLMIPVVNYGVKCLSMGMLVDDTKPIVWRGPLVMSAVQRLLKGSVWEPLDILIIDTPPGTGDVHLSLAQHIPIDGALIVSTPQAAALDVTRRGAEMYRSLKIPLLGFVENMQHVRCDCGKKIDLFDNVTQKFAKELGIELLASIPVFPAVTSCCDAGLPLVIKQPESEFATIYRGLAAAIFEKLVR